MPQLEKISDTKHHVDKQIDHIVKTTVKCAISRVEARDNNFEVIGYDFMLDENLHAWLIEINRSPDMGHSTAVTAKLVPDF